jgi:hypothetical protein
MALGWQGWYCLAVILVGVILMACDFMGPDIAMMGMLIAVMLPGERILTMDLALEGFANEGLLTVISARLDVQGPPALKTSPSWRLNHSHKLV